MGAHGGADDEVDVLLAHEAVQKQHGVAPVPRIDHPGASRGGKEVSSSKVTGKWNICDQAHDLAVRGLQHPADRELTPELFVHGIASPKGHPIKIRSCPEAVSNLKRSNLAVVIKGCLP